MSKRLNEEYFKSREIHSKNVSPRAWLYIIPIVLFFIALGTFLVDVRIKKNSNHEPNSMENAMNDQELYVCPPCDLACDTLIFTEAGICPHCKMKLIRKSELIDESLLVLNEVKLKMGSGVFLIEGAAGRKEKVIKIYYHKPKKFSNASNILIVIPGAGRDGDEYRDAWIEASEKYDVLVLSPMFEENDYGFEDYHLCGLIKNSNLRESIEFKDGTNLASNGIANR